MFQILPFFFKLTLTCTILDIFRLFLHKTSFRNQNKIGMWLQWWSNWYHIIKWTQKYTINFNSKCVVWLKLKSKWRQRHYFWHFSIFSQQQQKTSSFRRQFLLKTPEILIILNINYHNTTKLKTPKIVIILNINYHSTIFYRFLL